MGVEVAVTRGELAAVRAGLGPPVVLVPTMGALHAGHRQLLERARELAGPAGSVAVSIFVNPLQFGPGEGLDKYPRTLEADLAVCADAGVRLVFAPSGDQMYPREQLVTVDPGPMGQVLEGEFRPGFFNGVLTVVLKLFQLVRPDVAVFGEKDAQQLALVRRMVADFDLGITVSPVSTVRDDDGVATSSRNRFLSGAERSLARALPSALFAGLSAASTGPGAVLDAAQGVLDAAGPSLRVDYLALVDPLDFRPAAPGYVGRAVLAVAARAGATRLIDNVLVDFSGDQPPEASEAPARKADK